jgi:hypothetical protein
MVTHTQKIDAERRMRDQLQSVDLPQPDRVEYGFACVRFFFDATKHVVVIDIEEPSDGAAEVAELGAG